MPITEVEGLVRVSTQDLAPAPFAGGGAGNSLYNAAPGDGTWAAAPNADAVATVSLTFIAASFAVFVQTAAVQVRVSSDGGANYGAWVILPVGVHSFELDATDIQVREAVDDAGGEYQIVSFA